MEDEEINKTNSMDPIETEELNEQVKKAMETDKKRKIKNIGEVCYISKKTFKKNYSMDNVGYSILGFIGDGVTKEAIGEWVYNDEPKSYYAFKKNKRFYEIIGYVEVEKDKYIAIIQRKVLKKIFPFLIFLLMLLLVWYFFMVPKGPELEDGMGKYQPESGFNANTDSTSITLPGYKDINMEANTNKAYVALYNPEGNPCYFKFKIKLVETGETIYESKLIPPGYAVTDVTFDRKFQRGIYPLSIVVETSSLDNYKVELNGGDIKTRLVAIER